MKTAISIPDKIFRQGERKAKQLKISRSELYRRALESFLIAQTDEALRASYDAAFGTDDSSREAAQRRRVAKHALLAVEWRE